MYLVQRPLKPTYMGYEASSRSRAVSTDIGSAVAQPCTTQLCSISSKALISARANGESDSSTGDTPPRRPPALIALTTASAQSSRNSSTGSVIVRGRQGADSVLDGAENVRRASRRIPNGCCSTSRFRLNAYASECVTNVAAPEVATPGVIGADATAAPAASVRHTYVMRFSLSALSRSPSSGSIRFGKASLFEAARVTFGERRR
jgi:hypothetical protein